MFLITDLIKKTKHIAICFYGSAKSVGKEWNGFITTDASSWGFGGWSEGDWHWFLGSWEGQVPGSLDVHSHAISPPPPPPTDTEKYQCVFAVLCCTQEVGTRPHNTMVQVVTDNNQVLWLILDEVQTAAVCLGFVKFIGYVSSLMLNFMQFLLGLRTMFSQRHYIE